MLDYSVLVEAMKNHIDDYPDNIWKQFLFTSDPGSFDPKNASSYSILTTVIMNSRKWSQALADDGIMKMVIRLVNKTSQKDQHTVEPVLPSFFTDLLSHVL